MEPIPITGRHLLYDAWTEAPERLRDAEAWRQLLVEAAKAAGATVLGERFHAFAPPGGLTGIVLLAESHLSVHTWPETGFLALDCFTCGTMDPEVILEAVRAYARPVREQQHVAVRGALQGVLTGRRT